jgi:uncharacterized protein (TIGR02271 family)
MYQDLRQIQAGWSVYGRDNEKVGEIQEVGPNYLLVRKGWLFTRDLYIPRSAIADVQPDAVVLTVRKDEVNELDWTDIPPADTDYAPTATTTADTRHTRPLADTTAVERGVQTPARADVRTAATQRTEVAAGEEVTIPVVEEDVRIGKKAVDTGGVRVTKRVEEVPVHEQVTLRDETVHVERRAVDRPVADADAAAVREGTFEMHEVHEEAVVDKQARVVEDVVVRKIGQEHTETVQETARRTKVDIEEVAGVDTSRGVTSAAATISDTTVDVHTTSTTTDEGAIERGASKAGNAVERATGADIDRDGDVGRRDPRNNV